MKTFRQFNESNGFWGNEASGVLLIAQDTGRILVGLRSGEVLEPYTWGNFGGAIGLDDAGNDEEKLSPTENAIKEMSEEVGYTGELKLIPAYIFQANNFKYYNFIGIVPTQFVVDKSDLNWEVDDAKWFTLSELMELDDKHFGIQGLLDNSMELIKQYSR
jgi:8-oxo-dGTP pyrophosphatase MutT (NUDIX family)